jgi:hypothetical protein
VARHNVTVEAVARGQLGSGDHDSLAWLLRREAVGEFPGSDDFLYINDKKSILRWAISVSGAPLRPPAALL